MQQLPLAPPRDPDAPPELPPPDLPEWSLTDIDDCEADAAEEVERALREFCQADDVPGFSDLGTALHLDLGFDYGLSDARCIALFAPEENGLAAPAQVDEFAAPYEGPQVDVEAWLDGLIS